MRRLRLWLARLLVGEYYNSDNCLVCALDSLRWDVTTEDLGPDPGPCGVESKNGMVCNLPRGHGAIHRGLPREVSA